MSQTNQPLQLPPLTIQAPASKADSGHLPYEPPMVSTERATEIGRLYADYIWRRVYGVPLLRKDG